ncbi:MAG: NAD(P)/FAD-dependent oxidoreductase [Planctomycetia bacterium]|nr:NAD(P)/FAD-dependent oxidoreductase [Planctomycetia bacterium]
MTTDWDVIVIGAGPAGSVASRQIALLGRRVLLLDKKRFPRRKVCGACLNHSAVELLEQIGLGEMLQSCGGAELNHFQMRAGSRQLSVPLSKGLAVSRMLLDQRLVDEAIRSGVTFRDGVAASVGSVQSERRCVELRDSSPTTQREKTDETLTAKVVLVADGLGHPSLSGLSEFKDRPLRNARVGAGCEVRDWPSDYKSGTIHMAVGRRGYVGLTCVENCVLNIAAAFDASLLRAVGGPARAAASVLSDAGFPPIPALSNAEWLGTPALTRTTWPIASERLFVLGDAAGYVEPFTGEGIGWALSSAVLIAPLAHEACESWSPSLADAWRNDYVKLIRRRQRICRMLAELLRFPTCVRIAMFLLPWMPRLLRWLVRGVSLPR